MSHNITVEGGTSVRLPTAGKYCDRDIVITATGNAAEVTLQSKSVTPSKSTQEVKADAGYTGLEKVTVSPIPSEYIIPSGTKTITENGTHDAKAYASVSVNVPSKTPVLQEKTVTPATDAQTVAADSGYDGLSKVTVNAMPTANQALPTITVDNSGLILATAEQQAGYVVAGTRTGMKQLTTQAGKTVTPSKSEQTVVESGRYTTGAVKVAAIPDSYIQPSGSLDITENGTHDVKNYASVNVNVEGGGGGGESPTALLDAALDGSLTSIDSTITSVAAYACRGFSKLKTVNLPNATSIGTYAFYYCTVMTSINAPKVTSLGTYAFYNTKLASVNFPLVTTIAQNSFYTCKSLEIADFGVAGTINQAAFAYCANLKALILRKSDGICKLATATNALQGSSIANGTGYVYVPKALLSDDDATKDYRRATNWSGYADLGIFRAIEDYPEICG